MRARTGQERGNSAFVAGPCWGIYAPDYYRPLVENQITVLSILTIVGGIMHDMVHMTLRDFYSVVLVQTLKSLAWKRPTRWN